MCVHVYGQDRELVARVDIARDANQTMHVCCWDESRYDETEDSLNEQLVADGWLRSEKKMDTRIPADWVVHVRALETAAKKSRVCVW